MCRLPLSSTASPSEVLAEPGAHHGTGSKRSVSRTLSRGFDRACPSPLQGGVFQRPGHRRPPTNRGRPAQQHASVKGSAGVRAALDPAAGRVGAGLPSGQCSLRVVHKSGRPSPRDTPPSGQVLREPPSAQRSAGRHSRPDTLSSGSGALPGAASRRARLPSEPRAGAAAPAELAPVPASPAASALRAAARVVLPALGALAGPGPMGWAPPARRRGPAPEAPPCLQAPGFGGGW